MKLPVDAVLLIAFGGFGIGTAAGVKWAEHEWRTAIVEAVEIRADNNRLVQRANDAKTLRVGQDHEKQNAALKDRSASLAAADNAAGGLRIDKATCDSVGLPGAPSSDAINDEYLARTIRLPAEVEQFLYEQADRADAIVEQARAAQEWAIAHGFVPESK